MKRETRILTFAPHSAFKTLSSRRLQHRRAAVRKQTYHGRQGLGLWEAHSTGRQEPITSRCEA